MAHPSWPHRAWVLLTLATLFSCGGARPRVAPGATTTFRRYVTAHVRMETDLAPDDARDLARRLERLHHALASSFFDCGSSLEELVVDATLFSNRSDHDQVVARGWLGAFVDGRAGLVTIAPRMIVFAGPRVEQTFAHELTHRFAQVCLPTLPVWLDEGLASVFETIQRRQDELVIGLAPYAVGSLATHGARIDGTWVRPVRTTSMPSATRLMQLSYDEFHGRGERSNYAAAWLLAHELVVGPDVSLRERLRAYLAAMHEGRRDPAAILAESFAGVDLDGLLDHRMAAPPRELRRFAFHDEEAVLLDEQPMAPSEIDLRMAELLARRTETRALATTFIDAAATDPAAAVHAHLLRASIAARDDAAAWVERAQALAPHDREVLLARVSLALEARTGGRELAALRDQVEALPSPTQIELVQCAELQRATGQEQRAIATAERALQLDPSLAIARLELGLVYLTVHRVDAARVLLAGAANLFAAGSPSRERQVRGILERLGTLGPLPPPAADPTPLPLSTAPIDIAGETQDAWDARTLGHGCVGFAALAPLVVIDVPVEAPRVHVHAHGAPGIDTTLVIAAADGTLTCDDDSGGFPSSSARLTLAPGRTRVWVGTYAAHPGTPVSLRVELDQEIAVSAADWPRGCGETPVAQRFGGVVAGLRIRLGRHTPVDVVAEDLAVSGSTNWATPMEPFVGQDARVVRLEGVDVAGCVVARVDVDRGRWLWRVRDMTPPPPPTP